MGAESETLEREAYSFISQDKFEEAFNLFRRAAETYRKQGNHKQSTLCFASAASCWNKKCEEKTFYQAALSYKDAAGEAEKYGDFEYASLLYKHAAINHERDAEFSDFSDCFYRSKECYRKFLTYSLFTPGKIHNIRQTGPRGAFGAFARRIISWCVCTFSYAIWGHGEKPARTLSAGIIIVLLAAALYAFGYVNMNGFITRPGFLNAVYFSFITFTTVGYGDITPVGFAKAVAAIEAFSGLFIMPLFVIGLARKYLRI